LVSYLGEVGISAQNNPQASWGELVDAAGYQPMVTGGRAWNHWVGVRMGSRAAGLAGDWSIVLMNPAPGYMGVDQLLDAEYFDLLGPFSAVWFTSW
jgi:hypothetical protein